MRDIVYKLQDLTHLFWNEKTVTSGTGGTFLKSKIETSRSPIYYKLSRYDRSKGIYGHESVNELVASRLLDLLDIPHVPYKLIRATVRVDGEEHETWLSESRDYRSANERRQQFDTFYDLHVNGNESPLDFAIARGWSKQIFQMVVFDYLIINRDRHGANFEVVFRDDEVEFAPLYDHGLSFVCSCCDDEQMVSEFDAMRDCRCNNYIGGYSLEENLQLAPKGLFQVHEMQIPTNRILNGLERSISPAHLEKIEEILCCRWRRLIELGVIEAV